MSESDLESYFNSLELGTKQIKDDIFRICWYMRGGISADDLFNVFSFEDREILNKIINDNIEATKKSGLPLI